MSILHIALAPLLFLTLHKRISSLLLAVKDKKQDKVKIELLFISFVIIVSAFVILKIENIVN